MPQDTRTLRSLRAAAVMPDQSSRMSALSGRVATQARNQAGGSIRFPDAASRMRYIQGAVSTQQRHAALPPAPTAPGAPTTVIATRGNQQASVSFAAPADDGGTPIFDYTVYTTPEDATATASSSPILVTGLTNGTAYTFRVKARNAIGTSSFSYSSDPVTPATLPGPPTDVSGIPGDRSITVSFTPPVNTGGYPINNYTVTAYLQSDDSVISSIDGFNSPITIISFAPPFITNGVAYYVKVAANTNIGSTESVASNIVIPATTPAAPTNLIATPGDSSISIAFTAGNDGGSALTDYKYSLNGGSYTVFSPRDTASPVVISGLINGTPYTVRLKAVNSVGDGAASATFSATPISPVRAPYAPTNLLATTINPTSVVISFTAGATGGSSITNYEYLASIEDGYTLNVYTALNPADATSPITITGLTASTSYSIRIRAVNSQGSGDASEILSILTPAAPPPPTPTARYALPADSAAYIYFDAGTSNGTTITNYEYSIDDGSFVAVSPADITSPIKVSGLTNGTTHSIRIRSSSGTDTSSPSDAISVVPAAVTARTAALEYDPSNTSSYSGAGTTITNVGSAGTVSGTFNGAVSYNASVKGGVLDFPNANSQTAKFISFPSYDFGDYITVAAWVYPREKHSINGLLTNAEANVNPAGFKFQWNWWNFPPTTSSKNLTFQAGNGTQGGDVSSPANTIDFDKWQHFTYIFDKVNQRTIFFLNGLPTTVSSSISTVANINTTGKFNIGAYIKGSYTMNAQLGSIKVYSDILTASDINAEYTATRARFHAPEKPTGLSASVVSDFTGISTAEVSFTPGDNGGYVLLDYEYSLDDGITFSTTGYTTEPITIIGLYPGTYQLRVRGVNEAGAGAMSDAYNLVIISNGPPPPG